MESRQHEGNERSTEQRKLAVLGEATEGGVPGVGAACIDGHRVAADDATIVVVVTLRAVGNHVAGPSLVGVDRLLRRHVDDLRATELAVEMHAAEQTVGRGENHIARPVWRRIARIAGEFMAESDRPFFLMVNYADAHLPFIRQQHGLPEKPFEAGVVITIEPGVYMPEKNLGVRIEDTILVTEDGYEVLSKDVPKEISEIEKLMDEKA